MPEYEFKAPDGKTYSVTGPEGSTAEQAFGMLQRQLGQSKGAASSVAGASAPVQRSGTEDFFGSIPGGMLSGLSNALSTGGQAAQIEMGQPVDVPSPEEGRAILEKNITGELPRPQGTAGRFGEEIGEALGSPASYLGPGGLMPKVVTAVTGAIGTETGRQMTEGTSAEPYAAIAGGVIGGSIPRAGPRVVTPLPATQSRRAATDVLRREGVNPTAGQVTGSRALRRAEGSLGDAIGAGGAAEREYGRVGQEYTRALSRQVGEDATHLTPEVLQRARDRLSDTFERVAAKLPITHDRKFSDELTKISADLLSEGLPPDSVNRIVKQIDNVQNGFVTNKAGKGIMKGDVYQVLTRKNTPLARAIDDADPNISYYATRIRTALDDAMERSATGRGTREGVGRRQALEDLRTARRQWYNSIVLGRAVAGAGERAAEGIVTPQKLRQILTGGSPDRQLSYSLNRGSLAPLARAGVAVLDQLPNSNTAERAWLHAIPATLGGAAGHMLTGNPMEGSMAGMMGGTLAPGLTGRGLLKPVTQSYLGNQVFPNSPIAAGGGLRGGAIAGMQETEPREQVRLAARAALRNKKDAGFSASQIAQMQKVARGTADVDTVIAVKRMLERGRSQYGGPQ